MTSGERYILEHKQVRNSYYRVSKENRIVENCNELRTQIVVCQKHSNEVTKPNNYT